MHTPELNEVRKSWMIEHDEVIKHYPPQYIVGKQVGEDGNVLETFENESVLVQLVEVTCEYIFSNPNGNFNLSLPDKLMRTKNYTNISYVQYKLLLAKNAGLQPQPYETRDWAHDHIEGAVILKLLVQSKISSSLKVSVVVSNENDQPNVFLPETPFKETIFSGDSRAIAHFVKIEPMKDWGGKFTLFVSTPATFAQKPVEETYSAAPISVNIQINPMLKTYSDDEKWIYCINCQEDLDEQMQYCRCGTCRYCSEEKGKAQMCICRPRPTLAKNNSLDVIPDIDQINEQDYVDAGLDIANSKPNLYSYNV